MIRQDGKHLLRPRAVISESISNIVTIALWISFYDMRPLERPPPIKGLRSPVRIRLQSFACEYNPLCQMGPLPGGVQWQGGRSSLYDQDPKWKKNEPRENEIFYLHCASYRPKRWEHGISGHQCRNSSYRFRLAPNYNFRHLRFILHPPSSLPGDRALSSPGNSCPPSLKELRARAGTLDCSPLPDNR